MNDKYELLVELGKRRGFFWQSFEIYGGAGGFIDLGPLGVELKRKIEDKWRKLFVKSHGFIEVSTPVIMPSKIFEASGHLEHFKDPMVECLKCKKKYRADQLINEATGIEAENLELTGIKKVIEERNIKCLECGGELSEPEYFTTMFKTTIGPYSDSVGYARPETAQGIFINFKRLYEVTREKLPLGVAQIGLALRNEISPRQGPIRLREFTLMELELFFDPENPSCTFFSKVKNEELRLLPIQFRLNGKQKPIEVTATEALEKDYIKTEWLAYFMALSKIFLSQIGIPEEKQRFKEKLPQERAHYSIQTYDHEVFLDRWGWIEVAGLAYRTDYDLARHIAYSKVDLKVFKAYSTPEVKKIKIVKPSPEAIKKDFKNESNKIFKFLSSLNPEELDKAFKEKGFFEVENFKIYPTHVQLLEKQVKETGKKIIPHVVEPSFGVERLIYAVMEYSYSKIEDRVVMKIPKDLAPLQVGVFPLVPKDELKQKAWEIYLQLLNYSFNVFYDEEGSIGRRYARADEAGVPIAITIDRQTLKDETVTLRDRDSWKQIRIKINSIKEKLSKYFNGEASFEELNN
ncbi:MAG: glycine--tRNA ligase [Candidatus Bathyarchaeia archaeon]|nr:glycine--tRNA ligase [Candidatus Bathyarchaeota archaeon]